MKMKKFLSLVLVMALCLTALAACGGNGGTEAPAATNAPAAAGSESPAPAAPAAPGAESCGAEGLQTGLNSMKTESRSERPKYLSQGNHDFFELV